MNKKELRDKFKDIRLHIQNKAKKSNIITNKVISTENYKSAKVIALYCSMPCEVDTALLIEKTLSLKKKVVLPKIVKENNLEFYEIFSVDDINNVNFFGIKEPVVLEDNFISASKIDLMIIPGICFDIEKNRIGFGKGYYDRYLQINSSTEKMGICFYEQLLLEGHIPSDEFDIKMDMIITDREIVY